MARLDTLVKSTNPYVDRKPLAHTELEQPPFHSRQQRLGIRERHLELPRAGRALRGNNSPLYREDDIP